MLLKLTLLILLSNYYNFHFCNENNEFSLQIVFFFPPTWTPNRELTFTVKIVLGGTNLGGGWEGLSQLI